MNRKVTPLKVIVTIFIFFCISINLKATYPLPLAKGDGASGSNDLSLVTCFAGPTTTEYSFNKPSVPIAVTEPLPIAHIESVCDLSNTSPVTSFAGVHSTTHPSQPVPMSACLPSKLPEPYKPKKNSRQPVQPPKTSNTFLVYSAGALFCAATLMVILYKKNTQFKNFIDFLIKKKKKSVFLRSYLLKKNRVSDNSLH